MSDNVKIWSANQEKFIEWLALPGTERFPPTQDLLAKEMELRPETLTRWKRIDGFMGSVTDRARQYLRDDLSAIYNALAREASKGSYQHIKLALEVTGEYVERREFTGKDGSDIKLQIEYVNNWRD